MTKTEFAELLKIANDQLAECIRSHILALRGEITSRLETIDERLKRIEAKLDEKDGGP